MKLLKAFVRASQIREVVHALERARAPGITVSIVRGVGEDFDPRSLDPRIFKLSEDELCGCPEIAKLEIVCGADHIERLLDAVVAAARTGGSGDGIVFVSPIDRAVKIRTGEEGVTAFAHSATKGADETGR